MLSLHHIYCYEEWLYVPRLTRTEAGFYLETDPVRRVRPATKDLTDILEKAIGDGNPRVRTPTRDEHPSVPHVVRAAGARTFLAFERRATLWDVLVYERDVKLELMEPLPKGGWGPARSGEVFPRTTDGLDALADAIITKCRGKN